MILAAWLILCFSCIALYGLKILIRGNYIMSLLLIFLAMAGTSIVIHPEYATKFANYLGVGRGADLLLYLFFMMMVVLILLAHVKFKQYSILITNLARSVALADPKIKK